MVAEHERHLSADGQEDGFHRRSLDQRDSRVMFLRHCGRRSQDMAVLIVDPLSSVALGAAVPTTCPLGREVDGGGDAVVLG